jgi:hypothetical protein
MTRGLLASSEGDGRKERRKKKEEEEDTYQKVHRGDTRGLLFFRRAVDGEGDFIHKLPFLTSKATKEQQDTPHRLGYE